MLSLRDPGSFLPGALPCPRATLGFACRSCAGEEVEGAEVRLYGQDLGLERSSSLTHPHWLKLSHMAPPAAKETGECASCMPQKEGRRGFSGHLAISSPPVTAEIEEFCQNKGPGRQRQPSPGRWTLPGALCWVISPNLPALRQH